MALKVIGIAGSLRTGSYNRALLRAAKALAPAGMEIEIAEIASFPLFNEDLEAKGTPLEVLELKRRIAEADALLIATPEYNHSVPGVLKNAIDWLSREPDMPLEGKPTAIMGASTGMIGTARSQMHLRIAALAVNMPILQKPEIYVATAQRKFDEHGELTDEPTRARIKALLAALMDWTLVLQRGRAAAQAEER
jgi:chromate reductase